MASSEQVVFIVGGGPRIGHSVATKFLQEGYKVALGRRNTQQSESITGITTIAVDVTKPDDVARAFQEVESKLGIPNVVVYNTAALTMPPEQNDPFSTNPEDYDRDLAVNTAGAYAVLHHATRGFKFLKDELAKSHTECLPTVFIATGNVTPFYPHPMATTLGSGKAALTYLIALGEQEYKKLGYRFFFASQVTAEGHPVAYPDVSGDGHGEVYWQIVKDRIGKSGWDVRFVVGPDGSIHDKSGET